MTSISEDTKITFPLVLDGGLSNQLEAQGCSLNSNLWTADVLVHAPEQILQAHKAYLESGADIIATATYQASKRGLEMSGFDAIEIINRALKLAKQAIEETSLPHKYIAASHGPYGAYLADGSEYRGHYLVSSRDLRTFHSETLEILAANPVDFLACETIPSHEEAAILAELLVNFPVPVWVSFTCSDGATIRDGTPIEQSAQLFKNHPSVFAVGINCTSPQFVSELIPRLQFAAEKYVVVYPNAGSDYDAQLKTWADTATTDVQALVPQWLELGAVIVGGCCQVGPSDIQLYSQYLHQD